MHPILGQRRRLGLYLVAWAVVGLLLAAGLRGDAGWAAASLLFVPLTLAYAFVTLSSWYVCRAFPLQSGAGLWRIGVVQLMAALFAGTLWTGAGALWAGILTRGSGVLPGPLPDLDQQPLLLAIGALLFALAALFHYLIMAFEASRAAETRALESTLLAREAELHAIRAQIDPHFIFNSLHSVSALTAIDPAGARRMCLLIAEFLRDTLRLGSHRRIPLGDELALVDRFLAIEQVRLEQRLQVARTVDPAALSCPVPPLLLQPLVENAVTHGISHLVDGGTIDLTVRRTGMLVSIAVENPCDADRPRTRGTGLGLALLRERMTAQYGGRERVLVMEREERFRVELVLPAEPALAEDQVVLEATS